MGDLAPVSSSSVHLPSLDQLHTLRATGFTFTAAVLRDGISDLAHFEFAGDWRKKKKRAGVLLPLLVPLLPFCLPFFPSSAVFCLFNRATTCSLASGGAAADEQAGGVWPPERKKSPLFFFPHCGLLREHTAPLMSERKTSGGGIE